MTPHVVNNGRADNAKTHMQRRLVMIKQDERGHMEQAECGELISDAPCNDAIIVVDISLSAWLSRPSTSSSRRDFHQIRRLVR